MVIDKDLIRRKFHVFGYLPFLYLLEECEINEDYENCQIIFDMINEKSIAYDLMLPTRLNDYAISYFFKAMEGSTHEGQIAFKNMPYFVEELKNMIEKFANEGNVV